MPPPAVGMSLRCGSFIRRTRTVSRFRLAFKSKDLAQPIRAAASLLDYITPRSGNDRLRGRGLWDSHTPPPHHDCPTGKIFKRKRAGLRPPGMNLSAFVSFTGLGGTRYGFDGQGQRARRTHRDLAGASKYPPLRASSILRSVNELVNRRSGR